MVTMDIVAMVVILTMMSNLFMLFFKKTLLKSGLFNGFVDNHSHILPGVDDGIRTVKDSLSVLRYYQEIGVSEVWLTPHIMEDMPNKPDDLRSIFADLEEKARQEGITVTLHLGAENMLDSLFAERLAADDLLPIGNDGNTLLVETSYYSAPVGFYSLISDIREKGYRIVLAHPERYQYMEESTYEKLKGMGLQFQLNLNSLSGMYGPDAQTRAHYLLQQKYYNLVGTDLHNLSAFRHYITQRCLTKRQIRLISSIA